MITECPLQETAAGEENLPTHDGWGRTLIATGESKKQGKPNSICLAAEGCSLQGDPQFLLMLS